jgi:2-keto-4-pentenoate hydratase/2-oxohepta-3-ene-1,7-dioic acid hydratase in catechol pathway
VNYRSHARQSGFGEDPPALFFRKSSASVSGPTDDIMRPAHVRLLDDELELGLVIRWSGTGRAEQAAGRWPAR